MVVSIASQKGGTGKSSTSISLSAGLARQGKRVLLIDIDSQANSSKVLLPHYTTIRKEETIYVTILERMPLPIHQTSYVLIDCPPALSWLTINAFTASEQVLESISIPPSKSWDTCSP
ncbi:MAG: hypothetical protein C4291_14945 [Candidatus Dadabacteria bacterium]